MVYRLRLAVASTDWVIDQFGAMKLGLKVPMAGVELRRVVVKDQRQMVSLSYGRYHFLRPTAFIRARVSCHSFTNSSVIVSFSSAVIFNLDRSLRDAWCLISRSKGQGECAGHCCKAIRRRRFICASDC